MRGGVEAFVPPEFSCQEETVLREHASKNEIIRMLLKDIIVCYSAVADHLVQYIHDSE